MSSYSPQGIAILIALGGQAKMDLVEHCFDGGQFYPHGADASPSVVSVGQRYLQVDEKGGSRWSSIRDSINGDKNRLGRLGMKAPP